MKKERVKLTPASTMLLSVLFDLVRDGEFVSEFSAEKIVYFLQRFGAKETFKLDFQPNFYGPYSGKVKEVLFDLNGYYISGYSSKNKNPFEILSLMVNTEKEVNAYLDSPENKENKEIVQNTKKFLSGYYADFGLELLSTVDYIITDKKTKSVSEITTQLENWNKGKKTFFTNPRFINLAVQNIEKHFA
jgi:uncharacterized protein YwgA